MFSFWYRNIKVAENFRGNISFVKTQTRLKLLCLSWIYWRCERQSRAESILGNSCWFSADDLKFEFWPVEIDSIYLGGTKLAEEESVSKKVCFERKSKYQHEHQKEPGLQSLCISLFVFWFFTCVLCRLCPLLACHHRKVHKQDGAAGHCHPFFTVVGDLLMYFQDNFTFTFSLGQAYTWRKGGRLFVTLLIFLQLPLNLQISPT